MVYNQLTFIHEFVTGKGHRRLNVELNMTSVNVEGGARQLRATWTPELAQDLEAYHNIDPEAELTALRPWENLTNEIDREIIDTLLQDADNVIGERAPQDPIQPRQGGIRTPNDVLRRQREEIVERWAATGLLEGLEHNPNRQNIAQLMESQAQTLINEEPPELELNPPQRIEEQIQFPMVRRVFSHLVANDIVTPIGNVRYNEFNHNLGDNHFIDPYYRNNIERELGNSIEGTVNWRTDDTWSYETLYGSLIGITMDLEPLKMVPKKNHGLFDLVTLPSVRRTFV